MSREWMPPTARRGRNARQKAIHRPIPGHRRGWVGMAWASWPLSPPPLEKGIHPAVALRMSANMWAAGHAQAVWETRVSWVSAGQGKDRLERQRVADEFALLSLIGQHIVGCDTCRVRNKRDTSTPEEWLWRAVMKIPRLRDIAVAVDGGSEWVARGTGSGRE